MPENADSIITMLKNTTLLHTLAKLSPTSPNTQLILFSGQRTVTMLISGQNFKQLTMDAKLESDKLVS